MFVSVSHLTTQCNVFSTFVLIAFERMGKMKKRDFSFYLYYFHEVIDMDENVVHSG